MFGYAGKVLRVDLTLGKVTEERLDGSLARKFIGGRGLIAKILFDELKHGTDPLGRDNRLVIATGPLVGLPIVGSAKHALGAKSPLTGGIGHSQVGGSFGAELKSAGYDAVVVEGKADSPAYLWIRNGHAEIRDASHLWGKPTREVQRLVIEEVEDDKAKVGSIGVAGENLVRYACVMFTFNHAAGRMGMGAVMGSKRLKAIAVRGTHMLEYANEQALLTLAQRDQANRGESARKGPYWPDSLFKYGSDVDLGYWQMTGRLPTMNFRRCTFHGADQIKGEAIHKTVLVKTHTCPYCPISCNRVVEAHYPYEVDPDYGGPEYETCAALGSLCMNENLVALCKANELCNKHGLDTISTGVVIAFAMECYEKRLLTEKETEGLELRWGNHEAMIQLIEKIARRQGIGGILADGVKRASDKIGRGSEEFAMHVKGAELPMHEARGKKGHGFVYAVSNRGANHQDMDSDDLFEEELCPEIGIDEKLSPRGRLHTGPEKVKIVKIMGDLFSLFDSLLVCRWTVYPVSSDRTLGKLVPIVSAATGWNVTLGELMTVGERIWNLERAFNVREGMTRQDDLLPRRLMEEPLNEGPYRGETFSREVLDRMLDFYYEFRGWNKDSGIPTSKKLEELGLGYAANELKKLGLLKEPNNG